MVKTLMAGEQGCGEKASDMSSFADIDSNVQSFMGKERSIPLIRGSCSFARHEQGSPFQHPCLSYPLRPFPLRGEKRDPAGVPLPTSDEKYGFNLISGVRTRPPSFFQESNSKAWKGSTGSFPAESYPTELLHQQ
jgi:hypothetical protein